MKLVDISGKRRNFLRLKLTNFKLTVRSKISETRIGASMILRRVTNLELIVYRMRIVIYRLQLLSAVECT